MGKKFLKLFVFIGLFTWINCSGSRRFVAPSPVVDDRQPVPENVAEKDPNLYAYVFNRQISEQCRQSFDLSRQLRFLFGSPRQAMNLDAFDEVANSSWFTRRLFYREMSLEKFVQGPNTVTGPDTSGAWKIVRAKTQGLTPGFSIKDPKGDLYLIKFDPPGHNELASGAEVAVTKIFYAAGYNVPQNFVVYFHPDRLELAENVEYIGKNGQVRPMNEQDLAEIFTQVEFLPDGRLRALASKYLQGKPLGPFLYKGTRKDDPNDIYPHEHRRELRGLRVFTAWLNHFDAKAHNSLDMFVTENGKSYVKHSLIDFGSTLGNAFPSYGFENYFDPHQMLFNTLTLGLHVMPWEKQKEPYPSAGYFESNSFKPHEYKVNLPNPAFELMTMRDAYWAAKIVMSFKDEHIRSAIEQGCYTNPDAAEYLIQTLIERRDKIGRYYFSRVNPLDKFIVKEKTDGSCEFSFVDMAVVTGLEKSESSQYLVEIIQGDKILIEKNVLESPSVKIPAWEEGQVQVCLRTKRQTEGRWSPWVKVYASKNKSGYRIDGIIRQD
ncbi:hypothetical protein JW935_22510 [candidate division KSB1 bacterium]|nr:hypothetical protein [candidate division KSB1 bacterium]